MRIIFLNSNSFHSTWTASEHSKLRQSLHFLIMDDDLAKPCQFTSTRCLLIYPTLFNNFSHTTIIFSSVFIE